MPYHPTNSSKAFARFAFLCIVTLLGLLSQPQQVLKAQNQGQMQACGVDFWRQKHIKNNPKYIVYENKCNHQLATATLQKLNNTAKQGKDDEVYTIPTVVHLVHAPSETIGKGANLKDAQVQQAINWLNDAFNNKNSYYNSKGISVGIEFCLATRDPEGSSTTGIVRHASSKYTNIDLKEDEDIYVKTDIAQWDPDKYLNIWVVTDMCYVNDCNTVGLTPYATSAGTAADGILTVAKYFGSSIDETKVLIHEAGHYLNLFHTFENGCTNNNCLENGDYVCDTPPDGSKISTANCSTPDNSCTTDTDDTHPRNPFRAKNIGGLGDQNDPTDNYLDYNKRACKVRFTEGQKDRMRLSFIKYRSSLIESDGCLSLVLLDAAITDITNPEGFACNAALAPTVIIKNYGTQSLKKATINYYLSNAPGTIYNYFWLGNLPAGFAESVLLPPTNDLTFSGSYTLTAYTTAPNGLTDLNTTNDDASQTFAFAILNAMPFAENFELNTAKWSIINPDNDQTWKLQLSNKCEDTDMFSFYVNSYNYYNLNQYDYAYTRLDLNTYTNAALNFDVAYCQAGASYTDGLRVIVSTNCGETFKEVYNKKGSSLATKSGYCTSTFIPANCDEWRTETLGLSAYAGGEVLIGFEAFSENGNNIYIDNISITGTQTIICDPPTKLAAGNITQVSAQIAWETTEITPTHTLRYRPFGQDEWKYIYNISKTNTALNYLIPGTTYELQVQTTCIDNSLSPYCPVINFSTLDASCYPPYDLAVSDIYTKSASVYWEPVYGAVNYEVYYSFGFDTYKFLVYTPDNYLNLTDLYTNKEYKLYVRAICSEGDTSLKSEPIYFTPKFSCQPPNGLTAEKVTKSSALLLWQPQDGALSYLFEYRFVGGNNKDWKKLIVSQAQIEITDLTPKTDYEARIKTTCDTQYGSSDYSDILIFNTGYDCPAPQNPAATAITENAVTLKWEGFPGAFYAIRFKKASEFIWQNKYTTADSINISLLEPCTEYSFSIKTACDFDTSTYSAVKSFFTTCKGYALSKAESSANEWIEGISINNVLHVSGKNNGYADFTEKLVFELPKDTVLPLLVSAGVKNKGYVLYWQIWVDWNQNYDFEPGERIFSASNLVANMFYKPGTTFKGNFTIPDAALEGKTRMRVSMSSTGWVGPNDVFDYGEVEDYTVDIVKKSGKGGLFYGNQQNPDDNANADCYLPNHNDNCLQVQQNIANKYAQISLSVPLLNDGQFLLRNTNGQIVLSQPVAANDQIPPNITISTANLPAGLYICSLQTASDQWHKKLMVVQ